MSLATWTIGMRIECGPNKNSPIWETWKIGGGGEPLTRYVCLCVCVWQVTRVWKEIQSTFVHSDWQLLYTVCPIHKNGWCFKCSFQLVLTVGIETLQKKQRATPELLILILPKWFCPTFLGPQTLSSGVNPDEPLKWWCRSAIFQTWLAFT